MLFRGRSDYARLSILLIAIACCGGNAAYAAPAPAPWIAQDIGAPSPAGSTSFASNVFTVMASGSKDIWGTSDQFHFVYQQLSGDMEIIARVDSMTATDKYAKAGVMIRTSLATNSAYALATASPGNGVMFHKRAAAGQASTLVAEKVTIKVPVWVRLVRVGNTITATSSADGVQWQALGTTTVSLGTNVYVGLASTSRVNALATSKLSNVSVTSGTATPVPAPQKAVDIGAPAIAGSTTFQAGTYTMKAAGADIFDTSDQFHYVYQPITGDVEVVARLASVGNTNSWAKAGVMIRESLSANSRNAMALASAGEGYSFQRRIDTGGFSTQDVFAGAAPVWVRLVRTGYRLEAFRSTNGTTWTSMGFDTIPMADAIFVGLAATSHNVGTATTAVFDNVKITPIADTGNKLPTVALTSPATGASFTAPATVSLTATASDPENRLARVEFYSGATRIGSVSAAPFAATWANVPAGTYSLTAMAFDLDGGSATSAPATVTVQAAANQPPTVTLSAPASGVAPATLTLSASASDPEGRMLRVEFYSGTTLLSSDATAPYSFTWSSVPAGTYAVKAIAYDSDGGSASSAVTTITVQGTAANQLPTVTLTAPATGASITAPATVALTATATDPEGRMARVEFYVGTTLISTDTTSPYAASWSATTAGSFALKAIAYDADGGNKSSTVVNVTVTIGGGSTTVPAPQTAADIGAPTMKGSTTYQAGTYSMKAGGTDIWGTSDQFQYVYQPVTGDVEVIARVTGIVNTDPWAKAGVMIRESLAANSRHATALISAASGYGFQRRLATGGNSTDGADSLGASPGWVRLVRTGSRFEAFRSSNGTTWTSLGVETIQMGAAVYVGLAATSHNAGTATTVGVDGLTITAVTGNAPPTVALTTPTSGASFTAPATIAVSATASDAENRLARVEFYSGTTLIGSVSAAPFTTTWSSVAAGNYSITAKAIDLDGGTTTSAAATISVQSSANQPPTIALTAPVAGASITAPATVALTASATDPEGRMARVEFYAGTTLISTDTTSPYAASWAANTAGSYALKAIAYDSDGGSTSSAVTTVTVQGAANQLPTVTLTAPVAGASITAPATVALTATATDPEGRMARVEFYVGTTLIGTDTTTPYAASWSASAAGSYAIKAIAFDADGGSRTSTIVNVTVTAVSAQPKTVMFGASPDHATTLVTSYLLEVFANGANPSTATPVASSDMGKSTPAANNDISVDRAAFFAALPAGTYVATVSSIGPGGKGRSAALTFTR